MNMSKNSERIILVTGATGRQGSTVYRHLRKQGFKLRAWCGIPIASRHVNWCGMEGKCFRETSMTPTA